MKKRVNVLKDREGRIVATFDPTPNPFAKIEPVVEKEFELVREVEVPEDFEFNLKVFYEKIEEKSRKY